METILPNLDHSKKDLNAAFGLTEYQKHLCKSAILFEMLSLQLMVKNLYDDINEAPANMCTITGVLEHSMQHMKTQNMQSYLLLTFMETYSSIDDTLENLRKSSKEADMNSIEDTIKHFVNQMEALPIKLALQVVQEVNHDFDAFVAKLLPEDKFNEINEMRKNKDSDEESEIDRLIREALKKRNKDTDED